MSAEWPGAMRCRHGVWIHPLARCSSAAAVTITRGNTSFGVCRCRKTNDRQGGAYRADRRLTPKIPPNPATVSDASKFLRGSTEG
jgi:hypothetical protein